MPPYPEKALAAAAAVQISTQEEERRQKREGKGNAVVDNFVRKMKKKRGKGEEEASFFSKHTHTRTYSPVCILLSVLSIFSIASLIDGSHKCEWVSGWVQVNFSASAAAAAGADLSRPVVQSVLLLMLLVLQWNAAVAFCRFIRHHTHTHWLNFCNTCKHRQWCTLAHYYYCSSTTAGSVGVQKESINNNSSSSQKTSQSESLLRKRIKWKASSRELMLLPV